MAREILRGAVYNDVAPCSRGRIIHRSRKSAVDNKRRPGRPREFRDLVERANTHQRIRNALGKDEARFLRRDNLLQRREIAHIDICHVYIER